MGAAKREELRKKLLELESQNNLIEELPHLYGKKHYKWSSDFIKSRNRLNFLCAANQIGKSSANIRKAITWATTPKLWKKLWPSKPSQFWYFYPSIKVCTDEFNEKWVKEWLPRGDMKNHPVYGWTADIQQKKIFSIRFNTGVTIYFRSYEQKLENLQTSSVHAVFADEEMPVDVYNEVIMRISAPMISGHFHMVFTATLGLDFWREVIEEKGDKERFKTAWKRQVSMYDCLKYEDGSPSSWTVELIKENEAKCRNRAEIDRRIHGKFVLDEGLKYDAYRGDRNFITEQPIPADWLHYSGVDIGSGGNKGHPSAIVFIAVSPDFRKGFVYDGWRGDGVETTASDVLMKYRMMRGDRKMVGEYYDWISRDFYTISTRAGEAFQPAEKSHVIGEQIVNVLFKNQMLGIFRNEELGKLDVELRSLRADTPKTRAKDDFADAMRYALTKIPWDFSCLNPETVEQRRSIWKRSEVPLRDRERLFMTAEEFQESLDVYQNEFDEANELMEYNW